MGRRPNEGLTARETELMEILWGRPRATAEEVRAALPGDANESTVRTMLRVLVTKGYAKCDTRKSPHSFRAALPRPNAQKDAIAGLLQRFFGGSAESLVLKLVEDEMLTPEQLEQLSKHLPRVEEDGK